MASNYPNGFVNGLVLRGTPLIQSHPGKVWWVSNSTVQLVNQKAGSDNNDGSFNAPFATLQKAVNVSVASRGDIIFVKPGHAETVATAAGIVLSTAGVAIIGLGSGALRPTFSWSTTTSTVTVTASQVSLQNMLFLGTAATTFTASAFVIANAQVAKDFTIDNCEFRDSSATTGFIQCVTIGTTANIADGLTFTKNKVFRNLTSPPAANTAVVTASIVDRLVFEDNYIVNTTANNNIALGIASGALDLTNASIARNRTASLNTGTTAGELFSTSSTACSGLVSDNYSGHLASTGLLGPTGTKFKFIQNFCHITGAADKSALINPAAV
jgi:hypothetical protein